jgi:basic amino acid/polyamine antiporter, APA family
MKIRENFQSKAFIRFSSLFENMSGQKRSGTVFARDATGLVRELTTFDSFVMNVGFIGIPWALATYVSAAYIFPGGDSIVATIITTAFCVVVGLMFSLITWAMPRTAGDYILMSRVLHPLVGFVASFNLEAFIAMSCGLLFNWVTTLAISPAILVVGTVTGNQSLVALANTLAQPQNVVIIGGIVVICNLLLLVKGLRPTMVAMTVLFVIGNVVGIGAMIWLLATHTNADFVNAFGRFANYDSIISSAHAAGYSPQGPNNFLATIGLMPFVFASLGYMYMTSYFGGEIKKFKRNALISQVVAVIFAGVILAILGLLATRDFGYDFLGSISYLSANVSSEYPFTIPPYFSLFVSILSDNPAVLWLIGAAFVASFVFIIITNILIPARALFAWSFDRILPTKVSEVNERFHTPILSYVIVSLWSFASLVIYTYGPPFYTTILGGIMLGEVATFIVIAVAAILLPFRLSRIYNESAAKVSVGGIPLISIVGVLSLGFYLAMIYFYLTNSLYGANGPLGLGGVACMIAIPAGIYAISYYYHKSKGLDISLVFKQIPPE